MLRKLHSWPGLIAALLVGFMAITGAVLSLQPVFDLTHAKPTAQTITVAQLASGVASHFSDPRQIVRSANGSVVVYATTGSGPQSATYVDPATGAPSGAYAPSTFFTFFMQLHRSLFLGQTGRAVAGLAAFALMVLAVSGILLLVKRLGGWKNLFKPARGRLAQRLHVEISRLSVVLLTVTALTGLYLSLVQFGLVSDGTATGFAAYPTSAAGTPAPVADLAALKALPVSALRELDFPMKGDASDVFALTTASGAGYVDQVSGKLVDFTPNNLAQTIYQTIYTLHTGEGAWWFGLLLGLAALGVPVLGVSGGLVWLRRQKSLPRIPSNAPRQKADTIILVGSESNTSWGFAKTLHKALTDNGHLVHTAPMNALETDYRNARRLFILTSTHGDGAAPHSADRFLSRLDRYKTPPHFEFAVLGFGDKSFPQFCAFAETVDETLAQKGWRRFQTLARIDRQSAQAFAQWGHATGAHLGMALSLQHTPEKPRTRKFVLVERDDYGVEVEAPTTIFRFKPEPARNTVFGFLRGEGRLPKFKPGDIAGILPPQSPIPRFYSIASDRRDGRLEICVRRQQGGECSEFLHDLRPGARIEGFVEPRPDFRPQKGTAPVVMIGAGTGIAPFAGFIKSNQSHRPLHLYWGGRDPRSDFLYGETLLDCLADDRLTRLVTGFSRPVGGAYVQDKLREDRRALQTLIYTGAQIMVCGGREMADAVKATLDDLARPLGLDLETLKAEGRYVEDVY